MLTKYGRVKGAGLHIRYKPTGHIVIVAPDPVEEKTAGGIALLEDTTKDDAAAQTYGTVLAMGPDCYIDLAGPTTITRYGEGETHLKKGTCLIEPGSRVLFQRYVGMKIPGPDGELRTDMLLLNEQDITAVVVGESPEDIPELPEHLKVYLTGE